MTKNPTFKAYSEPEILQKAWEAQLTSVPSILKEVDVDQECLASLEEEMFENTDRTGVSGNWQWGLDRGHHQGGWDPSFGVPASWNGKVRAGSESEREVRPNYPTKTFCSFIQFGTDYIHFTEPTPAPDSDARPRPQPRPKNPKKGSHKTTK